jgi:beta-lactamase regulating signal transducer with metallopeptidase domain
MNSLVETLNHLGGSFPGFAWPMFWQSSLLIAALIALDFLFRRQQRASLRYALWLVVLVKLCVPPTFALPTSPAWWLHQTPATTAAQPKMPHYTVTYDQGLLPELSPKPLTDFMLPKPAMTYGAWLLVFFTSISLALLFWMLARWWQIVRLVRRAAISGRLTALAGEVQRCVGMKGNVRVKLTPNSMSPAVCGLFRPAILIPQSLAEKFSDEQLRAVLLHELIHLRRRDVWLNFMQALLQIGYWWHPLVWLANARIRRVREEAVDDAVMLTLRDESETYAPTLLEVAKLALNRPLVTLGLVGILESRSALRQRIERLVDFHPPRQAGLTLASLLGILAFTAVALPMGQGPKPAENVAAGVPASGISLAHAENAGTRPMTILLKQPIRSDALLKKLREAGVEMPPPVFIYKDNRMLFVCGFFVRGTLQQLVLVNRLGMKLNGISPKDIDEADKEFRNHVGLFFESAGPTETNLIRWTFKVDTNTIANVLREKIGLTNSVQVVARSILSQLGVDLESSKGKSVFYNDRLGLLFVTATASDIDTIEKILSSFDFGPPQIHIKARFVEVPKGTFQNVVAPNLLTNVVRKSGADVGSGLLADKKFRIVMQTLKSTPGFEDLAEPEATTISGREVQMRATEKINVVTNFTLQETSTNRAVTPQVGKFETGKIIDVVPVVLGDSCTIDLKTTASVTYFDGYDKTTNTTVVHDKRGAEVNLPQVLPKFSICEAHAHVNIFDNQTVVLSGLIKTSVTSTKTDDQPPVKSVKATETLIFITATLVDSGGNRIYADDALPFARDAIPLQPITE